MTPIVTDHLHISLSNWRPWGRRDRLHIPRSYVNQSRYRAFRLGALADENRGRGGGDGGDQQQGDEKELMQRLRDLQRQQQEVARQLASLQGKDHPAADFNKTTQKAQGPPLDSPARAELERLLGFRPPSGDDVDDEDPLDACLDFKAMEDIARSIEQGERLPPAEYPVAPEPADQFVKRVNDSIKRFQRLMAGRKARKGRKHKQQASQVSAAAGQEQQNGEQEDDVEWNEDDEEALKAWKPFDDVTVWPEDIELSRPAPDIPPEIDDQLERCQRALYVLRRGYLGAEGAAEATANDGKGNRFASPSDPLDNLINQDLVDVDNVVFDDPWVQLKGAGAVQEYLAKIAAAGAEVEVDTLFANFYQYQPSLRCGLVALTFIHLPLPLWYNKHLALHPHPLPPPDPLDGRPRRRPGEPISIELAENSDLQPHNMVLYPRIDDADCSNAEEHGTAHVPWLQRPVPLVMQKQVLVPNYFAQDDVNVSVGDAASSRSVKLLSLLSNLEVTNATSSSLSPLSPSKQQSLNIKPNYRKVLPMDGILDLRADSTWYKPTLHEESTAAEEEHQLPPLPRPSTADLDTYPLTADEAEQILRNLIGEKDFDKFSKQLPAKYNPNKAAAPLGARGVVWKSGEAMSIAASWVYDFNAEKNKVEHVQVAWSWVGGPFPDLRDAYDVWVNASGLVEWETAFDE